MAFNCLDFLKVKCFQRFLVSDVNLHHYTTVPIFAGMAGQVVPWYTFPAAVTAVGGVALLTNSGGGELWSTTTDNSF